MRLICLGDSNTYGYDPRGYFGGRYDTEDRWPDLLAMQTGLTVVNWGVNGAEIPMQYPPIPTPEVPAVDTLLVMLGTNDLLQGASAKRSANRMEAFLIQQLPHYRQILLVAPPPMKRGAWVPTDALVAESLRLAEEYRLLAERLNIPFVDTRRWNVDLTFDGVHFSEEGHHTFAANIASAVQPWLYTSG